MARRGKAAPLRVVFVATDFSPSARRAVARAALIARSHGARLVVFNALDISAEALEDMGGDPADLARHFHAQLERELARASAARPGIRVEADFRFGKPFVEIIRAAREAGADLIVEGARGEAGPRGTELGGTAEKVLGKADRPVLIVRGLARRPYARAVVAVDFSAPSRLTLETALRVAPEAELHVLHAYGALAELGLAETALRGLLGRGLRGDGGDQREQAQAGMDQFLRGIDLGGREPRMHFEEGSPKAVLPSSVRSLRPGLLAVGAHGRTGLAQALLGSVAERAVRDVGCDVLVARTGIRDFRLP